jgi:hypothetical protein
LEAWGPEIVPYEPPPLPEGNLALNRTGQGFPKASASFTSNYDRVERVNDGRSFFTPSPSNRWTSWSSPNSSDWLEIDFGSERAVARVDLHIYDDAGGVQAPVKYAVEYWAEGWQEVPSPVRSPANPAGGMINTVHFHAVKTSRLRVVFIHAGKARSGLTEIEIWEK